MESASRVPGSTVPGFPGCRAFSKGSAVLRTVKVRRDAIAEMIAHARAEAPNECCGLLVGEGGRIDEIVRCTNLEASPVRYRLDPQEHIDTNRRLRHTAHAVVGVYHSHPHSPAVPSARDIAEAHYPEFVWIVVSLEEPLAPDVRAHTIAEDVVTPVAIEQCP
jgi:[CysO sulfur-carrier protein]-S-L-cysteine hydrolase